MLRPGMITLNSNGLDAQYDLVTIVENLKRFRPALERYDGMAGFYTIARLCPGQDWRRLLHTICQLLLFLMHKFVSFILVYKHLY